MQDLIDKIIKFECLTDKIGDVSISSDLFTISISSDLFTTKLKASAVSFYHGFGRWGWVRYFCDIWFLWCFCFGVCGYWLKESIFFASEILYCLCISIIVLEICINWMGRTRTGREWKKFNDCQHRNVSFLSLSFGIQKLHF